MCNCTLHWLNPQSSRFFLYSYFLVYYIYCHQLGREKFPCQLVFRRWNCRAMQAHWSSRNAGNFNNLSVIVECICMKKQKPLTTFFFQLDRNDLMLSFYLFGLSRTELWTRWDLESASLWSKWDVTGLKEKAKKSFVKLNVLAQFSCFHSQSQLQLSLKLKFDELPSSRYLIIKS